jgi:uncharacterized repeat protein (TIGR03803 family)
VAFLSVLRKAFSIPTAVFNELYAWSGGAGYDFPVGNLVLYSGYFYGVAQQGGASESGYIFKIKTDGTNFLILHTFNNDGLRTDAVAPASGMTLASNGVLQHYMVDYMEMEQYIQ